MLQRLRLLVDLKFTALRNLRPFISYLKDAKPHPGNIYQSAEWLFDAYQHL